MRSETRLASNGLRRVATLGLTIALAATAQAGMITFRSSVKQTSLIELYTSEGCNSCPPAEAWLSRQKSAAGLWKKFVPVAFHVDYWDSLGWRDPWGSKDFSERQRTYARLWRSHAVYTPGFALNGSEWRGWEESRELPRRSEVEVGVLAVSSPDARHWRVSFVPTSSQGPYEVHATLLASGLVSDVRAGENRGRRLNHDFVAVGVVTRTLTRAGEKFIGECVVAPARGTGDGRLGLAVWVTRAGRLEPLQSVGGWLGTAH